MNRQLPIVATLLFLFPTILFGQEAEAALDEGLSLWGMIKQRGWAMYPLGLCSLSMLFLILHCWRETNRAKFVPVIALDQVARALSEGKIDEGLRNLSQIPSVLSRALTQSLSRLKTPLSDRKG